MVGSSLNEWCYHFGSRDIHCICIVYASNIFLSLPPTPYYFLRTSSLEITSTWSDLKTNGDHTRPNLWLPGFLSFTLLGVSLVSYLFYGLQWPSSASDQFARHFATIDQASDTCIRFISVSYSASFAFCIRWRPFAFAIHPCESPQVWTLWDSYVPMLTFSWLLRI